jgi:hypothetical protein
MSKQEQIIRRYLLGELSESEQATLEQQYFDDQKIFEHVVQVENDLVDKYAHGLLPPATSERFEKYYMAHPQRKERAKFAEALAARVEETKAVQPVSADSSWWNRFSVAKGAPRFAWGFSIAVVLFAAMAGWFFIDTRRLRQELARIESERVTREQRERNLQQQVTNEQLRTQQLSEELERLRTQQGASPTSEERALTFATLSLTITGTRGFDGSRPVPLRIPDGTEQVRLLLSLRENNYDKYQVVIQSASGSQIFSSRLIAAPNKKTNAKLSVVIPAQRFTAGGYIFTLRGSTPSGELEDVSKSLINVEKKQ